MIKYLNLISAIFELLESFWKPYIDVLPEKYNTVLYFTAEELAELKVIVNRLLA